MSDQVRIKTDELPPRARNLAFDEISRVFGGCDPNLGYCTQDSDCCPRQICGSFAGVPFDIFGVIKICGVPLPPRRIR